MHLPVHKTKIVCTIGPASAAQEVMERMLIAGMNVARLNFSHGAFEDHRRVIANLRAAERATGRPLTIMADLPGPKIRVGPLREEPLILNAGDAIALTVDDVTGDRERVSVSFKRLPLVVRPGDALYLNDGIIQLETLSVSGNDVACRVVVGGELRSHKGLNLPGIDLGISAFTDRDHECLKFAAGEGIDAISQSFVETGADLREVRRAAEALGYRPFLIAKIERRKALDHMDDILDAADGIMIARGDLGVEVPVERIASIQKELTRKANRWAKPVIVATQMLESMKESRRPTRAEATDVANSILDGTDCVMLSGESALGRHPVEAVEMLARIAAAIEPAREPVIVQRLFEGVALKGKLKPAQLIAVGVEAAVRLSSPAAVFVPTRSGATARSLALCRLPVWVVAISRHRQTCRDLAFSGGVYPVHEPDKPEDWNPFVRGWLERHGLAGDLAVLTEGPSTKHPEAHNRMEIIDLRRQ